MHYKSIIFAALLAVLVLLAGHTDASVLKLKTKAVAVAAPHVAAHFAVASSVKAATGNAIVKSIDAIKAKKAAVVSIVTAPLRVAAKTVAIKVGAAKVVTAAKASHIAGAVRTLQAHPIVLPVPVPVVVPVTQVIPPVVAIKSVLPVLPPVLPPAPVLPALPALPVLNKHQLVHSKLGHVLNTLHVTGH